jgi:hypothetical protein
MDREGVRSLRSHDKPQLSIGGRRRLAVSLGGLAAGAAILLAACGNADHKVSQDTRPDPTASTNGAASQYPEPVGPASLNGTASPVGTQPPPEDLVSQQGFGERKNPQK